MENSPKYNPASFARSVVKAALERSELPQPPDEEFYRQPAASFVSIKKNGELRGCIGTLEPVEPDLGRELARNASSAAFSDPRFPPIGIGELDELSFSVDVLSPSEGVAKAEDLDCEKYGVIVSCDYRRGVLLPALEGVSTVEDQLAIACNKAGIAPHERFRVERFTVDRYREEK